MKKLTQLITAAVFTLFAAVSQATIMQDIIIENAVNDPFNTDNAFGIADGFSGVVGSISYNPGNVDAFGTVTAADDEFFSFSITLGSVTFDITDDLAYPLFPLAELNDPAQLLSGIGFLDAEMYNGFNGFLTAFGIFDAVDEFGNFLSGDIRFGTPVPEPSIAALMLAALVAFRVRKKS
ncbi:PEP-CTERM sorting domain-containing protein [Thalassotalea euphylliae]|uniref:PEP-CTERM sorting domain-containing protein n=1 Tax=Thalassotalea euphylliae TaxID=1655234 RepID=UPI003635C6F1